VEIPLEHLGDPSEMKIYMGRKNAWQTKGAEVGRDNLSLPPDAMKYAELALLAS
jgi:hypothetical protein